MDRLSYGRSSLCQESRRLALDGKMPVALTARDANKAHGLSIQESHTRYLFFLLTVGNRKPTVQVHNDGFLIKRWLTNMYRNSNTSCVTHNLVFFSSLMKHALTPSFVYDYER